MITEINPPEKFEAWNVMFWEPESKRLLQMKKEGDKNAAKLLKEARKIIEEECIKTIGYSKWRIYPTSGHLEIVYLVTNGHEWTCNCKNYYKNSNCAHIIAVKQFLFMRRNK